jgi:hypothetical protein
LPVQQILQKSISRKSSLSSVLTLWFYKQEGRTGHPVRLMWV